MNTQLKKTIYRLLNPNMYLCVLTVALSFAFSALHAALPSGPVIVSATADTNQIRIGEQFNITLKATIPTGNNLNFPVFPDTLGGIEIISRGNIDTVIAKDQSNLTLTQVLLATSFDSGFYAVEPFHFTSLNHESGLIDTFATEAFLMTVKTIPVDTTQAIKDIKAPLSVALTLQEILMIIAAIVGALVLIWFAIRLWKKRTKKEAPSKPKVPSRPAHELALEALKRTESEKLWQQGFYKKYHSAVSDTLREYIERSFDVNALELTSDETLERIQRQKIRPEVIDILAFVLRTADLVKFAKMVPMPDENEKAMSYAYDFIHSTRPVVKADLNGKEAAV
jgi:hypothetical protein